MGDTSHLLLVKCAPFLDHRWLLLNVSKETRNTKQKSIQPLSYFEQIHFVIYLIHFGMTDSTDGLIFFVNKVHPQNLVVKY